MSSSLMADTPTTCLVLAPHLRVPPRNGADIYIERLTTHLSEVIVSADVVAEDRILRYVRGVCVDERLFRNKIRTKHTAAMRTILKRSHYLRERYLTPSYLRATSTVQARAAYQYALCSYISTNDALPSRLMGRQSCLVMLLTHNDEFKWFSDLAKTSNPLARWAARMSNRWLHRFFRRLNRKTLFLHATEADQMGFSRFYAHQSAIIPVGAEITASSLRAIPAGQRVQLLFVGSLSVGMNKDALTHFARHYEAALSSWAGGKLRIVVAGSNPSTSVRRICIERQWSLYADLTDTELDDLFEDSSFSILPFPYATGAKLKLLASLAHGVPFLATSQVSSERSECIPPCIISDNPADWLTAVKTVHQRGISVAERIAMRDVAERCSWGASARLLHDVMLAHSQSLK